MYEAYAARWALARMGASASLCHCRAMKTVGILGLGNIGRAVAANLAEAGFEVTAVRRASAADFPRLVDSPAELARTSDVVVAALASEEAMRSAYLGADGLVAGARPGLIAIDMGTFPVTLKRELADALAAKGAAMLDSPVSGTPPVVRAREAVLFVSGDGDGDRALPADPRCDHAEPSHRRRVRRRHGGEVGGQPAGHRPDLRDRAGACCWARARASTRRC